MATSVPRTVEITKSHELGRGGRRTPCLEIQFRRLARRLRGKEARADRINDTAEVEVIADHVAKLLSQSRRDRSLRGKRRNGYAKFLNAQPCARMNPGLILRLNGNTHQC